MTIINVHTDNVKLAWLARHKTQCRVAPPDNMGCKAWDDEINLGDRYEGATYQCAGIDLRLSLSEALFDLLPWVAKQVDFDYSFASGRDWFGLQGDTFASKGSEGFSLAIRHEQRDELVGGPDHVSLVVDSPLEAVLRAVDILVERHPGVVEG